MDGPQNVYQSFVGVDEIPMKDQPENVAWPEEWEGTMSALFAMLLAPAPDPAQNINLDMLRWSRETMHPRDYENMAYYDLWIQAVVDTLLITGRGGLTEADFIDAKITNQEQLNRSAAIREKGMATRAPGFPKPGPDGRFDSPDYKPDSASQPKFNAGDVVTGVLQLSAGHTRQYQYFRGRKGVVATVYPSDPPADANGIGTYQAPYPDIASRGLQEYYIPVYNVRFEGAELWGEDYAEPNLAVYVDQWETYLEPKS